MPKYEDKNKYFEDNSKPLCPYHNNVDLIYVFTLNLFKIKFQFVVFPVLFQFDFEFNAC